MNWDEVKGEWKQVKGRVKDQWGKLTDDDLLRIDGKKDELLGCLQQRYGHTKDQAMKSVDEFVKNLKVGQRSVSNYPPKEY